MKYELRPYGKSSPRCDCGTLREARQQLKMSKVVWPDVHFVIYKNHDDYQEFMED